MSSLTSKGNTQLAFKSLFLLLFIHAILCSPPENPINCSSQTTKNCTITNAYGIFPDRTVCRAAEVVYPSTEEELISIIASATRNNRKMKVSTRYSHSIPKLVCPEGQDGVLISTNNLSHILKIDREAMKMTVEPGVTLKELINEAAKAGLALPSTPYWWGITVGGLMATAAHGSSIWGRGSSVHDYVVELRIVSPAGPEDGYAKVRRLTDCDEDFRAAKVSLGVLGVISQVTLQLEPLFKRSITYLTRDDSDLEDKVVSFGHQHEFGDITWYPSQHKVSYRIDDRVSANTSGNGAYDFISFRPTASAQLKLLRSLEELQESTGDADGRCSNASLITTMLTSNAYGLTNNATTFTGYPVIGYNNRMQSSGSCIDSVEDAVATACSWDPRVKAQLFYEVGIAIPLSLVKNFIKDVKKLVRLERKALCGVDLYNGILMRYVKASNAYLGKPKDVLDFDIVYYRSRDPMAPRLFEDILEEIEQLAIFKYGGFPHWGKNRNVAFESVIKKYKNAKKFLKVKENYDKLGLFSNEWTDQVLGLKEEVTVQKDGCALEGLCICSQDSHCAPSKGYFCRPGKVYKKAKVCVRA